MPNDPVIYTDNLIETLYYLLYAKYGNSSFKSSDPNQAKYKLFAIVFEYGPAWKMRLQLQEKLFNLDPDGEAVSNGSIRFYNSAENPDTDPPTDGSFSILPGINRQNTSNVKRGKLEGYAVLAELIKTDVTEQFLGRFKKLFLQFVAPQRPLWYGSVEGDEEEQDYPDDPNSSVYGNYRTSTFQQVFPNADAFKQAYLDCGIPKTIWVPATP